MRADCRNSKRAESTDWGDQLKSLALCCQKERQELLQVDKEGSPAGELARAMSSSLLPVPARAHVLTLDLLLPAAELTKDGRPLL